MAATLEFIGTATTLLRLGPFTVLTDPNFLHRGQRAHLGKGFSSRRRTEPSRRRRDVHLGVDQPRRGRPAVDDHRRPGPARPRPRARHRPARDGQRARADPAGPAGVERTGPLDAAVVHLGGTRIAGLLVTMDDQQGADLVELLEPRVVVPVHHDDYGVFRSPLADFVTAVAERRLPGTLRVVGRGETVSLEP